MKSFALASGSSGNCFYIKNKENNILVDIGLSFSKTKEILKQKQIKIEDINSIFITHEHADHVSGFEKFYKELNCKFYMSKGTFKQLQKMYKFEESKIEIIKNHQIIDLNSVKVFVMKKPHDAKEALSFIFNSKEKKIGIFTDLGHVTNEILLQLKDLDIIYFEANYCEKFIKQNCKHMNINYLNRLMSDIGHLSLKQCEDSLKEISHDFQKIVLCHISENTNCYENTYSQIKLALENIGKFPELIISFQGEPTHWIE